MKKRKHNQNGQALVVLLVFVVMAVIYTTAAIVVIGVNSLSATRMEQGLEAKQLAESVVEDTIITLIRYPDYTGGTYTFNGGDVTVSVVGDTIKTITAETYVSDSIRTMEVVVDFTGGELEVLSWEEVTGG